MYLLNKWWKWSPVPCAFRLQRAEETEWGAAVPARRLWKGTQRKAPQVCSSFCFSTLQLSHNHNSHPTHSSPIILFLCSFSFLPKRGGCITVGPWIICGDLRLHKVPATQPKLVWGWHDRWKHFLVAGESRFTHTHTRASVDILYSSYAEVKQ